MTITYEEAVEGLPGWEVEDDGDGAFTVVLRDGTRCVVGRRGGVSVDVDVGSAAMGADTAGLKAKAEALRARWIADFGFEVGLGSALETAPVVEKTAYMGRDKTPFIIVALSLSLSCASADGLANDLEIVETLINEAREA